jgi:beta-glucanase (GH16 family)
MRILQFHSKNSRTLVTTLAFVLGTACVTLESANAQTNVYTPIDSSYKLVFDDEFNGNTLNLQKWTPNWLNNSATAITHPVQRDELAAYDPAQAVVTNGLLRLKAISKPVTVPASSTRPATTYQYRSGMIQSYRKFMISHGYFEARIYLPGTNGQIANWPAWWTNGTGDWPTTGEMDIMEGLRGRARYHFHSDLTHDGGGPSSGDYTGWHIYAALWEPGKVRFYYDGVKVGEMTYGITSSPMYLILNYAIGGYGGTILDVPQDMLVDYVHVYSKDPNIPAVTPEPNYGGPGANGGVVDAKAPSVPTGLSATPVSSSRINLKWNPSSDNVGVKGYRVFRDGVRIATTSSTSYAATGLSPSTTYSFKVAAFDAAGNTSSRSTAVSQTTFPPPDTTAPSTPTDLNISIVSTSNVTLTWKDSADNVGVAGYQVFRDNSVIATVQGTSFTQAGLIPGTSYSYQVSAFDAAGNHSSRSPAVSVTIPKPNIILNPGFVDGFTGWNRWNATVLDSTIFNKTPNSAKLAAELAGGVAQNVTSRVKVGGTYQLTAFGRFATSSSKKQILWIGVKIEDASGNQILKSAQSISSTTFQQSSPVTFTVPANAHTVRIWFYKNVTPSACNVDDFELIEVTAP